MFQASGKGALGAFQHEAGGHRWQRVSPTEKHGRVLTSTVTVAVLSIPEKMVITLKDSDLEWKATCGSGPGGQHRNKTASTVQLTHKPSGLMVRVENERSQHQNLYLAKQLLAARLQERADQVGAATRNAVRKDQVGVGARGDKRRTIALQRDQVVDHVLGKTTTAVRYLKGDLADLLG